MSLNNWTFFIDKSPIEFSIDQTDNIMYFINKWFPTGNLRNVDTPFCMETTYEK